MKLFSVSNEHRYEYALVAMRDPEKSAIDNIWQQRVEAAGYVKPAAKIGWPIRSDANVLDFKTGRPLL